MILGTVVLTTGIALVIGAVVAAALVAIARLLISVDDGPSVDAEPAWWPEFERQFADHVASRG